MKGLLQLGLILAVVLGITLAVNPQAREKAMALWAEAKVSISAWGDAAAEFFAGAKVKLFEQNDESSSSGADDEMSSGDGSAASDEPLLSVWWNAVVDFFGSVNLNGSG